MLDGEYLRRAKSLVNQGAPQLLAAFELLMHEANRIITQPPPSVMHKRLMPPSGDKHDYLSIAPYWWPDEAKPDGLPYIWKDGNTNPSAKNTDTDAGRFAQFQKDMGIIGLAYFFSDDQKYAQAAARFIRSWFLDPATRMNPNMEFGQGIMGVVTGRAEGLIDAAHLWRVIDAVVLIERAGILSPQEIDAFKNWFGQFAQWMLPQV